MSTTLYTGVTSRHLATRYWTSPKIAAETGKVVEELPIDPTVASLADHGKIELLEANPLEALANEAEKL